MQPTKAFTVDVVAVVGFFGGVGGIVGVFGGSVKVEKRESISKQRFKSSMFLEPDILQK